MSSESKIRPADSCIQGDKTWYLLVDDPESDAPVPIVWLSYVAAEWLLRIENLDASLDIALALTKRQAMSMLEQDHWSGRQVKARRKEEAR